MMTGISKHGMQQGYHFGESASVLFLAKKWFVISIRSCPLPCKTQYVPQSNHHRLSQPPSETVQLSLCVSTLSLCLFVARLERPLVDLHGLSFALPLRNRPPSPRRKKRPQNSHLTTAIDGLAVRAPGREDHCRCDSNPKLTDNPQRP
ncbi:hypothetical protein CPAR01_09074 [Colletotrichum paranaense]|uniref:Uncharacterized protein n=1 Tax=Colletotrichum paranaense TaxID=1914294 RepID=A0ABQ9SFP4_9PEZI|nr:uncharacterized protein CPAR01_09074 [Colletotrichum paranaense]KAK1535532.1 hypothetical protein CPAR01_09074 [Colletotrichum paranaense]